MKYIIYFLIILVFTNSKGCKKQNDKNIKLCLDKSSKGWFYIFFTNKEKGINDGKCQQFNKDNALILPENWLTDSTQMNLYIDNLRFNDSTYFFSYNEYQSENKYIYKYYSFFITDSLNRSTPNENFKDEQYFLQEDKLKELIKKYYIK